MFLEGFGDDFDVLNNPYFEFIVGRAARRITEDGRTVISLSTYPDSLGECDKEVFLNMMSPGYRKDAEQANDPFRYFSWNHPICFKNRD